MSDVSHTAEDTELEIDSLEGLQAFLSYSQEALSELEGSAKECDSEQLCTPFVEEGKRAYMALEALITQYVRVLDLGGFLDDEHIAEMQRLYDSITRAEDGLIEAMNFVPSEAPGVAPEEAIDDDVHTVRPDISRAQLSLNNESSEGGTISIRSHVFNGEEIQSHLHILKRRGEQLCESAKIMLVEYEALKNVAIDDDEYKHGLELYIQFEAATEQVAKQLETCDAVIAGPVTAASETFLQEFEVVVNDFTEHLKQTDRELSAYFNEDNQLQSEESVAAVPLDAAKQQVAPVAEAFKPNFFSKNELRPFIESALSVSGNAAFLASYFSSPAVFEAYLKREISEREKPSKFDKVFGISHKSPFETLLRDLTLAEVEHLENLPATDIRALLQEMDIQYEMYVAWMDAYDVMKEYVRPQPGMTFGDMFVRASIEDLKIRHHSVTH